MLELRPFQKLAIQTLSQPGHLICVSATGSGKSLIYEKLAETPSTRMLLITPLVALGRQQAKKLKDQGIPTLLTAGVGAEGGQTFPSPKTRAWVVSPESLDVPKRQAALRDWKPNLLVVDECHCVWEWGEQFRPSFQKVPQLVEEYSIKRSLWLTATLPQAARRELKSNLRTHVIEQGKFELPANLNLRLKRAPWPDRAEALRRTLIEQTTSGIIFVTTRESTERVARVVESLGKKILIYHAGMSKEERRAAELAVSLKQVDIIISTSAFGMGMDYPHLKWVILWQAPSSLLSLAQAVGRVGRAGQNGEAILFWDDDDFRLHEWSINGSTRRRQELIEVVHFYKTPGCKRKALSAYFN